MAKDMNQKKEERRANSESKSDEIINKNNNINWFPGHMTKATREMQKSLALVDMVIELRDCRIPSSSANPLLDKMINNKPRLIILTKKDKGESEEIKKWINYLSNDTTKVIAIDSLKENVVGKITDACKLIMKEKLDKMISRGIRPRAIRSMVVGIPNVGKSTLINKIASKKITQTSDKPGVTRSLQWVKLNKDLELLDTPGVLWPKFEDINVGYYLAIVGSINDNILPLEDVCIFALSVLVKEYPSRLIERYNIEISNDLHMLLNSIGLSKKWIKANNEVDLNRTMKMFLNELRDDKLGPITWEKVNEN